MINEMEKKSTMSKMSDLEFGKNSVEMMRYRDNKLSYGLGMGGIIFSVLAAFICLNSMAPNTVQVILLILLNIVILLSGFLAVEKTKAYSKNGSFYLIGLGAVNLVQISWIPVTIIRTFVHWTNMPSSTTEEVSAKAKYASENVGKVITEGSANSVHWLTTNGTVRGVLAIVFLIISAAFFITAGVFGYLRSKKLHTYLDSIKVNK